MPTELPPEPPSSPAAPAAPAEIPLPIDVHIYCRYIRGEGDIRATQFDDQIVFWNSTGKWTQVALPNWQNLFDSEGDFCISGDTLCVGKHEGNSPNLIHQYTLTDWVNGLPTKAVFIAAVTWGSPNGRNTRMCRTNSGGIFAVTFEWSGRWIFDTAYLPASGSWQTNHWEPPWPDDGVPAMGIECEFRKEDGRIYVFPNKDSSANIGLLRFIESDGKIVMVDHDYVFLDEDDGDMAPDGEFPQVRLEDGRLSYPGVKDSKYGCQWRLSHPVFTRINVLPEAGGWIDPKTLKFDETTVTFAFTVAEGLSYKPQHSADLITWTDCKVLEQSNATGARGVVVERPPGDAGFFRAKSKNYTKEFLGRDEAFVERSFSPSPTLTRADGSWCYFVNPMIEPECTNLNWYQRQLGIAPNQTPIDYSLLTYGCGWVMGRRVAACFLKQA